ncbi:MAG: hypothetical protein JKY95_19095 [Planctomycetaceae bacterium]|nr:hypothetical protein [Planctomycetaceae bacterium]
MKTTVWILFFVISSFGTLRNVYGGPVEQPKEEQVRDAIRKSLTLLEQAAVGTAEKRKCFTCHGQALPVMVMTEARLRGFEIDEKNLQRQLDHTATFLKRGHKNYLIGKGQGGRVDTAGYALWTLEAGKRKPDEVTNAVVEYLLKTNRDTGHWKRSSNRPPSEASDFTTTYLAMRAIATFGVPQQESRISERTEAASKWLLETKTSDTEDRVFQLRSLSYTNADDSIQQRLAEKLIAEQREDGGWSQKSDMSSDAYATGTVLTCLARTGHLPTTGKAYQRGLKFLLKSQHDDGSWLVVSRSKPIQTYFETGFPHGKDQFISTTATAWSTLALLLSLLENKTTKTGNKNSAD